MSRHGSPLLLGGCMVGPKYQRPRSPCRQLQRSAAGLIQRERRLGRPRSPATRPSAAIGGSIFGDPQLNALEEQVASPTRSEDRRGPLPRRRARMIRFNRAAEFPTISAGAEHRSAARFSQPALLPGDSEPVAAAGDFVAALRSLLRSRSLGPRPPHGHRGARGGAGHRRRPGRPPLSACMPNWPCDYFELRSADAQQQLLDDTVKAYSDALQLTTNRFDGGAAPKSDVAQAQTQLETARVAGHRHRRPARAVRARHRHADRQAARGVPHRCRAARPASRPPSRSACPRSCWSAGPTSPPPSAAMAEANEQIGIARAAFFPTLTLSAAVGLRGHLDRQLVQLAEPLLGGRPAAGADVLRRRPPPRQLREGARQLRRHRRQLSPDDPTAFQQVEDNLAALRILEQEAASSAPRCIRPGVAPTLQQPLSGGVDTYLQVITAQTTALKTSATTSTSCAAAWTPASC